MNEKKELYLDGRKELLKVMETLTKGLGSKDSEIIRRWKDVVGDKLFDIVKYSKTEKGYLYVIINDNIHKSYVMLSKKRIIDNFNSLFPERKVKYIKVIVIY